MEKGADRHSTSTRQSFSFRHTQDKYSKEDNVSDYFLSHDLKEIIRNDTDVCSDKTEIFDG